MHWQCPAMAMRFCRTASIKLSLSPYWNSFKSSQLYILATESFRWNPCQAYQKDALMMPTEVSQTQPDVQNINVSRSEWYENVWSGICIPLSLTSYYQVQSSYVCQPCHETTFGTTRFGRRELPQILDKGFNSEHRRMKILCFLPRVFFHIYVMTRRALARPVTKLRSREYLSSVSHQTETWPTSP